MKIIQQAKDSDGNVVEITLWDENPISEVKVFSSYTRDKDNEIVGENKNFKKEVEAFAGKGFLDA